MMRRSLRVLVVLLTVAVTAGVVWRATLNEQARGRVRLASQQTDATAADAIFELVDLRSTLHAFVAPGQSDEFWANRARTQIDSVRTRLREIEPASAAANHSLTTAQANLDALSTTARRAQASVRQEQLLIAGDIIFTEARDLIDNAARDLSDARQAMARAASAREAGTANEQSLLAGALIAVWIFALILLVPVPGTPQPALPGGTVTVPAEAGGLDLHAASTTSPPEPARAPVEPVTPAATVDPAADAPDPPATVVIQSLAELCADIGRVADVSELSPLLERAGTLVGARGLVVWLASADGQHLVPAMAHGYDQKLLARMGTIPVDDHNLTAAAFRTHEAASAPAEADTPGAVAVPMLSSSGVSGVLAVEVPGSADLKRVSALGGVIAAQLASLFPAPATTGEPPQHAHA